jgi:hypothetical protein
MGAHFSSRGRRVERVDPARAIRVIQGLHEWRARAIRAIQPATAGRIIVLSVLRWIEPCTLTSVALGPPHENRPQTRRRLGLIPAHPHGTQQPAGPPVRVRVSTAHRFASASIPVGRQAARPLFQATTPCANTGAIRVTTVLGGPPGLPPRPPHSRPPTSPGRTEPAPGHASASQSNAARPVKPAPAPPPGAAPPSMGRARLERGRGRSAGERRGGGVGGLSGPGPVTAAGTAPVMAPVTAPVTTLVTAPVTASGRNDACAAAVGSPHTPPRW